jgi:hypothetical protein
MRPQPQDIRGPSPESDAGGIDGTWIDSRLSSKGVPEPDDWFAWVSSIWARGWRDPREDIYTLEDGTEPETNGPHR